MTDKLFQLCPIKNAPQQHAPVNEDQTEKSKRTFYSKCGSRILLKYLEVGCPMVIIDCDHAGQAIALSGAKK